MNHSERSLSFGWVFFFGTIGVSLYSMNPFTRILIGLFVSVIGILMVYKTQWFMNAIGRISFAEKFFGGGGTRFFYKLLGVFVAIAGFVLATNLFELLFGNLILSLFGF